MLVMNAEISASATTPAETVIAQNAKDGTENNWIQTRETELLPVPYFHVGFTLPEVLNKTALHEPKMLYDILFETVWETLQKKKKKQKSPNGNDCCF